MITDTKHYSAEQFKSILELQGILDTLKQLNVHISGISDYEVHTLNDAADQPYISLT
jgi:hypothetical protein